MLPAPEFVLFLPHENSSRRIGMHLVRAGHRRHIRPPAAYHAVPVAIGGLLGAFFAPALRLAARTPLFRRVCTELPRKSRHTAPCQDHFPDAHVGDDALLHFRAAYRLVVGAGSPTCRRHWRDVAYPFVRHPEKGGAGAPRGETVCLP